MRQRSGDVSRAGSAMVLAAGAWLRRGSWFKAGAQTKDAGGVSPETGGWDTLSI